MTSASGGLHARPVTSRFILSPVWREKKTLKCVLILLLSGCETSDFIRLLPNWNTFLLLCVCVCFIIYSFIYIICLFVSIVLLYNPGCAMTIKFNLESMFVDTFWMLYNTFRWTCEHLYLCVCRTGCVTQRWPEFVRQRSRQTRGCSCWTAGCSSSAEVTSVVMDKIVLFAEIHQFGECNDRDPCSPPF